MSADRGRPCGERRELTPLPAAMPPARGNVDGSPARRSIQRRTGSFKCGAFIQPRRATTDSDGQFEFSGLPTVPIGCRPRLRNTLHWLSYGANRSAGPYWAEPEPSIELKDGQSIEKLVIALPRGGSSRGVTDERDSRESGLHAVVSAACLAVSDRVKVQRPTISASSGCGLSAGEYVVVADARATPSLRPTRPETEEERINFVTTYYPGTLDEGAPARACESGRETAGIDIRVGQLRLFHVSGYVTDSQGRPLAGANGPLVRRDRPEVTSPDSSPWSIPRVVPGPEHSAWGIPPRFSPAAERYAVCD